MAGGGSHGAASSNRLRQQPVSTEPGEQQQVTEPHSCPQRPRPSAVLARGLWVPPRPGPRPLPHGSGRLGSRSVLCPLPFLWAAPVPCLVPDCPASSLSGLEAPRNAAAIPGTAPAPCRLPAPSPQASQPGGCGEEGPGGALLVTSASARARACRYARPAGRQPARPQGHCGWSRGP